MLTTSCNDSFTHRFNQTEPLLLDKNYNYCSQCVQLYMYVSYTVLPQFNAMLTIFAYICILTNEIK